VRLDAELVRRGLVSSRAEAQEAVAAGLVTVDGAPALKSATQVHAGQAITVAAPPRRFVSRGGEKLDHALDRFAVEVAGRHAIDAGMSTGGFTDCLLQRGAAHVVGYDVGYGQVHERLRTDDRVTVHERTNIRDVRPEDVPPPPRDLVVCDVSFIALRVVLPVLRSLATEDGEAVVLVKPQFEADREDVGKGGVVRDPAVWERVLLEVLEAAVELGWGRVEVTASPLLGPAGNVEFLAHLAVGPDPGLDHLAVVVAAAVDEGRRLSAR
jgi:23S rRNA (cytidine1920-2'-O)/16S rRNA (cytidine1409-2'-O)-methyltransferase